MASDILQHQIYLTSNFFLFNIFHNSNNSVHQQINVEKEKSPVCQINKPFDVVLFSGRISFGKSNILVLIHLAFNSRFFIIKIILNNSDIEC